MASQLHPVLSIQDYFKHFEPPFRYEPLFLTTGERSRLALLLISSTHEIDDFGNFDIQQLPALQAQISYVNDEFARLSNFKRWVTGNHNYLTNENTFKQAITNTCWKMLQWAKRELLPDLYGFFEDFQEPEYTEDYQNPWIEFD